MALGLPGNFYRCQHESLNPPAGLQSSNLGKALILCRGFRAKPRVCFAMLITRRVEFAASHACWNPEFPQERNRSLYGETGPHGHGHNFMLEVTLEGEPDPITGMVFDLKRLKEILNEEVVNPMDHRFLNREVPPFDAVVPTTENISVEIWRRLAARFAGPVRLHAVRLYETEDLYVEYMGDGDSREAR